MFCPGSACLGEASGTVTKDPMPLISHSSRGQNLTSETRPESEEVWYYGLGVLHSGHEGDIEPQTQILTQE